MLSYPSRWIDSLGSNKKSRSQRYARQTAVQVLQLLLNKGWRIMLKTESADNLVQWSIHSGWHRPSACGKFELQEESGSARALGERRDRCEK
jgi:hypothetical protein